MRVGVPPEPLVVFPAAHLAVGDVVIYDDGDEATVCIGDITHGHFNPYDASLSDEQGTDWIIEHLLHFLDCLFADRVVLFKHREFTGMGGWRVLEDGEPTPSPHEDELAFVWSGPITNG